MNNPLVSVIIPTYKRSDFLLRAINSVLNQTYRNVEIIVVDDNDGNDEFRVSTEKNLQDFIDNNQITYLKHSSNKGISSARNTGIKVATGDYIAFLDDDDSFFPNKIADQLEVFKKSKPNVGLVYGSFLKVDMIRGFETIVKPKYDGNLHQIIGLNHIGPPSMVLCSKKAIDKIGGFDESFRYREDTDFFYRISEFFEFAYTNEILINYYVHSVSSSRNKDIELIFTEKYIEKHGSKLKKPKLRWSELQERLGELNAINGKKTSALSAFAIAYFNRPARLEILAKLALSLLGKKLYCKYRNVQ